MKASSYFWATLLMGGVGCASDAVAERPIKKSPAPSIAATPKLDTSNVPTELTDKTYERIKSLVTLRPGDLEFQAVSWKSSAYEGIEASQREDKPLLLWLYFGGPRGAC